MKKMRFLFSILTLVALEANATIDNVDFTFTMVCDGSTTVLTDASTVSGNGVEITVWRWDLDGDAIFETVTNVPTVSHQFTTTPVPVRLQIETNIDPLPEGSAPKQVSTYPNPSADFSAPDVCEGTVSTLNADNSSISSGSIVSWEWDFLTTSGVYDNATGSVINQDFVTADTYVVGLQVTSDQGCQSTTSKNVTVDPMPSVSFAASEICLGNQTELEGISTITSGQVVSFEWELTEEFGMNPYNDANGQSVTYQFGADGNYQVGLQVTSDQGCVNQAIQVVTIAPFPFVGFIASNACQNQPVSFENITNNVVGTIDYEWTFGNDGPFTETEPTYTFTGAGATLVTLIGETSYGCRDTMEQTVQVYPTPLADFTATEVCIGEETDFTNQTDDKGSTIDEYDWFFGDGDQGFGSEPSHEYSQADSFLVSMVASTTDGCYDTVQHYAYVWPLPIPEITADGPLYFCDGEDVVLSVSPAGNDRLWSNGDDTPTTTVDTTGNYNVQIIDMHGCKGDADVDVLSYLLPELTISNDTSISLGQDVPLWVEGADHSYSWSPETYLDDAESSTPISITPKETTTYTVTGGDIHYYFGEPFYCYSNAEVTIEVITDYNLGPVNLFTPNGDDSNTRFYIENLECYEDCLVKVYNRWGTEVYSSDKDKDEDDEGFWVGTRGGDELPDGTYYYTIECDGREDRFDGAVTIFRGDKRSY